MERATLDLNQAWGLPPLGQRMQFPGTTRSTQRNAARYQCLSSQDFLDPELWQTIKSHSEKAQSEDLDAVDRRLLDEIVLTFKTLGPTSRKSKKTP